MTFTPGTKIYVRYATGIMPPFTECLTISKYKNNLLYFKEKTPYYAVECHAASFYGFGYTMAGNVLVVKHKWQLPFAGVSEKIRFVMPARPFKAVPPLAIKMHLSTDIV